MTFRTSITLALILSAFLGGCGGSDGVTDQVAPEGDSGGAGGDAGSIDADGAAPESAPDVLPDTPDAQPEADSAAPDGDSAGDTIVPDTGPDTEPQIEAGPDTEPQAETGPDAQDEPAQEAGSPEADAPFEVGECAPGTTECKGASLLRTCDGTAHWTEAPCQYVCMAGACTGMCTPGSKGCVGNTPRSCDGTGTWTLGAACAGATPVCVVGDCVQCSPGDTTCQGKDAMMCGNDDLWHLASSCPFNCGMVGGVASCTGSCNAGDKRCLGLKVQTCDSGGQWQDTQTCTYVCQNSACAGVCSPGSLKCNGLTAQSCDGTGSWQDGQACQYVCSQGACTGSCAPGSKQCSGLTVQTCDSNGVWQNGQVCPFTCTQGACTGACTPGTKQCGTGEVDICWGDGTWHIDQTCQGAPHASGVCQNLACGISCDSGYKDCDTNAVDGCEVHTDVDASNCGSCSNVCQSAAHATPTCAGGACGIACVLGWGDCNSNTGDGCEQSLGSQQNCGACGHNCNGELCGQYAAYTCAYDVTVLATLASAEQAGQLVQDTSNLYYVESAQFPNTATSPVYVRKVAKTGGVPTTLATYPTGASSPRALTLGDDGYLYWNLSNNPEYIYRVSVGGGAVGTVCTNGTGLVVDRLIVSQGWVYWLPRSASYHQYTAPVPGASSVRKVATTGGTPANLASLDYECSSIGLSAGGSLAVLCYGLWNPAPGQGYDNGMFYWVSPSGTVSTPTGNIFQPSGISMVLDSNIFYTTASGDWCKGCYGSDVQLWVGVRLNAVDQTDYYNAAGPIIQKYHRLNPPTWDAYVVEHQGNIGSMLVDTTYAYWIGINASVYSIRRAPK